MTECVNNMRKESTDRHGGEGLALIVIVIQVFCGKSEILHFMLDTHTRKITVEYHNIKRAGHGPFWILCEVFIEICL